MCIFWEGKAAKEPEKKTRLRKKAKRMWAAQVGNGEEGVKNLFLVRGKKRKWGLQLPMALSSFASQQAAGAVGRRGLLEPVAPFPDVWEWVRTTAWGE